MFSFHQGGALSVVGTHSQPSKQTKHRFHLRWTRSTSTTLQHAALYQQWKHTKFSTPHKQHQEIRSHPTKRTRHKKHMIWYWHAQRGKHCMSWICKMHMFSAFFGIAVLLLLLLLKILRNRGHFLFFPVLRRFNLKTKWVSGIPENGITKLRIWPLGSDHNKSTIKGFSSGLGSSRAFGNAF